MEKRYQALRVIGTVYKVLGGIVGVLTIVLVIGICLTRVLGGAAMDSIGREFGTHTSFTGMLGGVFGGIIVMGIGAIIYGGGMAITLYAAGEGVYLLLAMEENTRATSQLLQQQITPPPQ